MSGENPTSPSPSIPPRKMRRIDDDNVAAGPSGTGNTVGQAGASSTASSDIFERIDEINELQAHLDHLTEQEMEAVTNIQFKYNKYRLPMMQRRSNIISKLPRFWLTALMNHPDFRNLIQDEEEDCLQYLETLTVLPDEQLHLTYHITLMFIVNPYFENTVLTRHCHFTKEAGYTYSVTPIIWKDGMNLIEENECGQQDMSFFRWFTGTGYDTYSEMLRDDLFNVPLRYYLMPNDDNEEDDDDSGQEEDTASDTDDDNNGGGIGMVAGHGITSGELGDDEDNMTEHNGQRSD